MDDLIRRGALVDVLANCVPYAIITADDAGYANGLNVAYCAAKDAPSVDAVEVVHARWREIRSKGCRTSDWICSACGAYRMHRTKYCPECGARMDAQTDHSPETGEAKQDG